MDWRTTNFKNGLSSQSPRGASIENYEYMQPTRTRRGARYSNTYFPFAIRLRLPGLYQQSCQIVTRNRVLLTRRKPEADRRTGTETLARLTRSLSPLAPRPAATHANPFFAFDGATGEIGLTSLCHLRQEEQAIEIM